MATTTRFNGNNKINVIKLQTIEFKEIIRSKKRYIRSNAQSLRPKNVDYNTKGLMLKAIVIYMIKNSM